MGTVFALIVMVCFGQNQICTEYQGGDQPLLFNTSSECMAFANDAAADNQSAVMFGCEREFEI